MTVPRSPDSGVFLRHWRGSRPVDLEGNTVEGALVDAAKGLAADEALEALDPERELA